MEVKPDKTLKWKSNWKVQDDNCYMAFALILLFQNLHYYNNHIEDISFTCLTIANLQYGVFEKLVEGPPSSNQIFRSSAINYNG